MVCANGKPADVLRELAKCFDWREADAKAFADGLVGQQRQVR